MKNHIYGGTNFPFTLPISVAGARIAMAIILLILVLIVGGLTTLVWWLI